ncbi:MAG: VCBS repeat-containing protein [Planctomycetes bacterium]|nr:VCBS repeat-containing protein [Planctomycetota bacterium]
MRTISLLTLAASLATPPSLAAQSPFRTNRNAPMPVMTVAYDLCTGDVDGDGDVDLVIGNDHDANQLFLNDGRGGFVDATAGRLVTPATPAPGSGYANATYEVDLADADGDGDLDLFVVNDHDVVDRLYLNDGLGFFTDVTASATPTYPDYGVDQVVADFDGDGDVDWLICNYFSLRLLLNNGAGVFTDAPAGSVPGNVFGDNRSFAADLDQDGDLDVVLGRGGFYASGNPLILVNQGNAVFALAPAATIPFPGLVHAADVDGDGKLDLLANNGSQLLRNLGGLVFAPAVALPSSTVASLDYDLDGDVDLIGNGKLLVNDGTGTFTQVTTGVTPNGDGACVADLDGDGDPDVVDTGAGNTSARFNFFNQVHTPTAPVHGQPWSIQLASPVRTTPVLWAPGVANGAAPAPFALPGLDGRLHLDPVSAIPLWPIFSTTGLDTITWTIPNLPALIGTELHYQAAVLDPLRPAFLTNATRDVIQ